MILYQGRDKGMRLFSHPVLICKSAGKLKSVERWRRFAQVAERVYESGSSGFLEM
jgi:hypothetical protein